MDKITSRQNARVKELVKLRDRSHRDKMSKFLIEGSRELLAAKNSKIYVEELYWCSEFGSAARREKTLKEFEKSNTQLIETSREVFEKFSNRKSPDGILGVGWYEKKSLEDYPFKSDLPLILILEGVEKPGNLGAILRSADCAGVDLVLCSDIAVDIYNPNVIRSSQGQVFSVPLISAPNEWILEFLREERIEIIVSTPSAKDPIWSQTMNGAIAIVMGSEKEGVSDFWMNGSFHLAKIPQFGGSDSLNLAAATIVFLYEANRQRVLS